MSLQFWSGIKSNHITGNNIYIIIIFVSLNAWNISQLKLYWKAAKKTSIVEKICVTPSQHCDVVRKIFCVVHPPCCGTLYCLDMTVINVEISGVSGPVTTLLSINSGINPGLIAFMFYYWSRCASRLVAFKHTRMKNGLFLNKTWLFCIIFPAPIIWFLTEYWLTNFYISIYKRLTLKPSAPQPQNQYWSRVESVPH